MTTAEALALEAEIASTPGVEIAGTLRASPTNPSITGYRVVYWLPGAEGRLTMHRRAWVQSQQEWEQITRKIWSCWSKVLADFLAEPSPAADHSESLAGVTDAPAALRLAQKQIDFAVAVGRAAAEDRPESTLAAAIPHFCRQHGTPFDAFLAGIAYHTRRAALHPEEYQEER